jgi:hypothetical protein
MQPLRKRFRIGWRHMYLFRLMRLPPSKPIPCPMQMSSAALAAILTILKTEGSQAWTAEGASGLQGLRDALSGLLAALKVVGEASKSAALKAQALEAKARVEALLHEDVDMAEA